MSNAIFFASFFLFFYRVSLEQGKKEYQQMPCMVEEVKQEEAGTPEERAEADELRQINEEILLIACLRRFTSSMDKAPFSTYSVKAAFCACSGNADNS